MAVNGIELEIGQRWIRRDGVEVEVIGHFPGREWPFLVAPVVKDCERRSYSVGADGFAVDADTPHKNDLTLLVRGSDLPTLPKVDPCDENVVTSAQVNDWIEWHGGECPLPVGTPFDVRFRSGVEGYGCESVSHLLCWDHTGLAGDVVAYRPVAKVDPLSDEHEALTFHDIQPVGVGDINSDAKGSGARYNTGKPPLELIPLSIIVPFFASRFDDEDDQLSLIEADLTDAQQRALRALDALGMFQARKGHVYDVLRELGDHWDGCAQVFDYGRKKYSKRGDCTCSASNAVRLSLKNSSNEVEKNCERVNREQFAECASPATTRVSSSEIRNTGQDKQQTTESGFRTPRTVTAPGKVSESDRKKESAIRSSNTNLNTTESSSNTDSHLSSTTICSHADVRSAEAPSDFASTIAMQMDTSEPLYAIPATLALDLSSGLTAGLNAHSNTCGVHKVDLKTGEWNWAKGMKWSIPIACAARHLLAIIRGETHDPESGKPHEWHVYCNVVMLLTFASTFTEGDDRPAEGLLL